MLAKGMPSSALSSMDSLVIASGFLWTVNVPFGACRHRLEVLRHLEVRTASVAEIFIINIVKIS